MRNNRMEKIKIQLLSNKLIYILIGVLAVGVIGVKAYSGGAPRVVVEGNYIEASQPVEDNLGSFPGGDIYADVNIHGTFIQTVEPLATSTTATTYTLVEKDLQSYYYIDLMVNTGATTFTMPATSTMYSLLPELGSSREWLIHNATSSSGITLTIAKGAGMDLVAVTANDDVIDPGEWSRLTCTRIYYRSADNENVMCIVDELTNAD